MFQRLIRKQNVVYERLFFDKLSKMGDDGHDVVPGDKIYMAKKSPQGRLIHQMRLFKNSRTESYSFDFLKRIE